MGVVHGCVCRSVLPYGQVYIQHCCDERYELTLLSMTEPESIENDEGIVNVHLDELIGSEVHLRVDMSESISVELRESYKKVQPRPCWDQLNWATSKVALCKCLVKP